MELLEIRGPQIKSTGSESWMKLWRALKSMVLQKYEEEKTKAKAVMIGTFGKRWTEIRRIQGGQGMLLQTQLWRCSGTLPNHHWPSQKTQWINGRTTRMFTQICLNWQKIFMHPGFICSM
ncbi:uncharacterized protein [Antennarius striatus]|uniref:uncharacterized protein isoform X2 n=1 Tax=Antennarius striatus TaxID=241820 RepID=UPI0035B1D5D0